MAIEKLKLVRDDPVPSPRKLGEHGRALWRHILSHYEISDAGGLELLTLAPQSLDRAEDCAAEIAKTGPLVKIKGGGMKEHPLLKCELASRALCARLLSRLGLDVEAVKPPGRPPGWA